MDPVTASLVIAGANTAIGILTNRKAGMQKNEASRIVDSVEVELKRIVATWNQTEPKTIEAKNNFLKVVLENFDKTKYFLMNPTLGDYGIKAITERFGDYDPITGQGTRGTGGNGWTDWWSYYWFPIMDTGVSQPTGQISNQTVDGSSSTVNGDNGDFDRGGFTNTSQGANNVFGGNYGNLLLVAGAGLVLFFMMKGK